MAASSLVFLAFAICGALAATDLSAQQPLGTCVCQKCPPSGVTTSIMPHFGTVQINEHGNPGDPFHWVTGYGVTCPNGGDEWAQSCEDFCTNINCFAHNSTFICPCHVYLKDFPAPAAALNGRYRMLTSYTQQYLDYAQVDAAPTRYMYADPAFNFVIGQTLGGAAAGADARYLMNINFTLNAFFVNTAFPNLWVYGAGAGTPVANLPAMCQKVYGASCAGDIECLSGTCKDTRCCNVNGTQAACNACDTLGNCKSCVSTHYFIDGRCVAKTPSGGTCATGYTCATGVCRGTRCCEPPGFPTPCQACGVDGLCAQCNLGYYIDVGGACAVQAKIGETCAADGQCTSGKCRGGRCCGTNGQSDGCTACSAAGDCTTCSASYYLNSVVCVALAADGGSCVNSNFCASKDCRGSGCCSAGGRSTGCLACAGVGGDCSACDLPYYLASGACVTKKVAGVACASGAECATGSCKGGFCCSADKGLPTPVLTCAAATGHATSCTSAYYVTASATCAAKGHTGQACPSDSGCLAGVCKGGFCCNNDGQAAACQTCVTGTGSCGQCISATHWLSYGYCVPLGVDGAYCSSGTMCASHSCKGLSCCATPGQSAACLSCGFDGNCDLCNTDTHYLLSGTCQPRIADGGACPAIEGACISDDCRGAVCCNLENGAVDGCKFCEATTGDCTACRSGYYMANSTCFPLVADGGSCDVGLQCNSTLCTGGACCTRADPRCLACSATGGCARCQLEYIFDGRYCVLPEASKAPLTSGGAAGVAIGAVVFVALIVILIVVVVRARRVQTAPEPEPEDIAAPEDYKDTQADL